MSRDDSWLLDILLAARRIERYIEGISRKQFEADEILQDAVIRRLEIIGEAAAQLTREARGRYPEVPWTQLIGLRNTLIHRYFRVELGRVWRAARRDVPHLITELSSIEPQADE
jgi:uncharacterized protein with HEPN domain